jgi:hypothetical protein
VLGTKHPTSLIYLLDRDGKRARLAATGFTEDVRTALSALRLIDGEARNCPWPVAEA